MQENNTTEMPKYKSHKVVHALRIRHIEINEDRTATITPYDPGYEQFITKEGFADRYNGDDSDHGYFVLYPDGYQSWSPSKAFQEGYSRIS